MTKQVYNYFYPEREERSADKFAQFIEQEKICFNHFHKFGYKIG